ncbi:MAG: hypothetical protein GY822_03355 [Deltaproteobacteria bacterium]|nr:hypothetical protein [Deltaproteobacteria bacterium]
MTRRRKTPSYFFNSAFSLVKLRHTLVRNVSLVVVGFCLQLGSAGCGPELKAGLQITTARLPLEGPCPTTAGVDEFSSEISDLEIIVKGDDMDDVTGSGAVGSLTIDEVPVGENRQVIVYGLVGGQKVWRGITNGVAVVENEDTAVDVLLSKVADLTCPRTPHSEGKAFHTATVLQDGRVLLVGGANANTDADSTCPGCRRLTASSSVEIYDPSTGIFSPMQSLSSARMMHTASLLSDGSVLVVGGSSETLVVPPDASTPFPLKPLLLVPDVEVIDPSDGSVTTIANGGGFGRVFHAATPLPSGNILISGGISAAAPIHNLSNALETTIVCELFSTEAICIGGASMTRTRAGHALELLETDTDVFTVVAWGGAVSAISSDGFPVWQAEVYDEDTNSWSVREVVAMSAQRNLFFAAVTRYVPYRLLAGGGLNRDADGLFDFARLSLGGVSRGPVLVLDTINEDWGVATGDPGLDPMHLDAPCFFGSAAALYGEKRAMIAGGFTTLGMRPSTTLDFFDQVTLLVTTLSVGGVEVGLREARGGLVASNLGNGTILLSGGQTGSDGTESVLMTSEIYTDIVDPAGE